MNRPLSAVERLPEEILMSILDYHFDLELVPQSVATEWSCRTPQLQLQHKLQMSLCRVSKRFRESISRLFSQNGLLRVTCWVDPHLDFYYFSPTVCLSDRTNLFQVPCHEIVIDLAHGLPEALSVRSIISAKMLPRVLEIARLHHHAALTVLPRISNDLKPLGKMTIDISCESGAKFPSLPTVEAMVSESLAQSSRIDANPVGEVDVAPAEGSVTASTILKLGFETWNPCKELPRPCWNVAFETGCVHCISTDGNHRRLGLQILRYLLATMLVAIEPWDAEASIYTDSAADIKMMTLISAILIDALVVEPELLLVLYGESSPDVIRDFHHEICTCKYLPYGICAGSKYGFAKNDETWLFVQTTAHFLHSMLVSEEPRRLVRMTHLRKRQNRMPQGMLEVRARCDVYLESLQRHYDNSSGCCYIPANAPTKVYIPA